MSPRRGSRPRVRIPPEANALRAIRLARRLSLDGLAARSGLSWSTVQAYETWRTSALTVRTLILLARALRCRPVDIIPALGATYGPTTDLNRADLAALTIQHGRGRVYEPVPESECALHADLRASVRDLAPAPLDPDAE